ncbi:uncharacterized protein METZ01_LOCUS282335 [marine metagenome]|uniref:Uncharacterized protein n=1 Tax=marine metagenome TaxID=408172 RepID=A0A382L3L4_9ZZZZ
MVTGTASKEEDRQGPEKQYPSSILNNAP